ncbi:hypothetical protein [Modestobacter sp. SYSU DS0290]
MSTIIEDVHRELDNASQLRHSHDPAAIKKTADTLVENFERRSSDLVSLSRLRPSWQLSLPALQISLSDAYRHALTNLAGTPSADHLPLFPSSTEWQKRLDDTWSDVSDDPWQDMFGIPEASVRLPDGTYSHSLLLAAFHGRYDELQRRIGELLGWIDSAELEITKGSHLAAYLLNSPRPFITTQTAKIILAAIRSALEDSAIQTAAALKDLASRIDKSYSNSRLAIHTQRAIIAADITAERAFLRLDLYRRAVEGQLRPWAWTFLRLCGRGEGERPPELAQLRERLAAEGSTFSVLAAACMNTSVRNAAAHEDYHWDSGRRCLVAGDNAVTENELINSTEMVYALMCGAELAWAKARASSPILRMFQDIGLVETAEPVRLRDAAALFGTNGLTLRTFRHNDDILEVGLASVTRNEFNPTIQATMWASTLLPHVNRFICRIESQSESIMDIERRPLQLCLPLWHQSRADESAMPLCVFLPAHTAIRNALHDSAEVAAALQWLALNDAALALDAAADTSRRLLLPRRQVQRQLANRLERSALALDLSLTLVEQFTAERDAAERCVKLLNAAARWTSFELETGARVLARQLYDEIYELYDETAAPEVFPTL